MYQTWRRGGGRLLHTSNTNRHTVACMKPLRLLTPKEPKGSKFPVCIAWKAGATGDGNAYTAEWTLKPVDDRHSNTVPLQEASQQQCMCVCDRMQPTSSTNRISESRMTVSKSDRAFSM